MHTLLRGDMQYVFSYLSYELQIKMKGGLCASGGCVCVKWLTAENALSGRTGKDDCTCLRVHASFRRCVGVVNAHMHVHVKVI